MLLLLDINTSAKYNLHHVLRQQQEDYHQSEAANTEHVLAPTCFSVIHVYLISIVYVSNLRSVNVMNEFAGQLQVDV